MTLESRRDYNRSTKIYLCISRLAQIILKSLMTFASDLVFLYYTNSLLDNNSYLSNREDDI